MAAGFEKAGSEAMATERRIEEALAGNQEGGEHLVEHEDHSTDEEGHHDQ